MHAVSVARGDDVAGKERDNIMIKICPSDQKDGFEVVSEWTGHKGKGWIFYSIIGNTHFCKEIFNVGVFQNAVVDLVKTSHHPIRTNL